MTIGQERDLIDGFWKALAIMQSGQDIARVENAYNGKGDSAVVLVVGSGNTDTVVRIADKIINKWNRAAA